VSIKILVLHYIYSSGITHAISFLCRDNLGRHLITLMYCFCEILETYVLEFWILMFVFEHVGNAL
jgi:hypothetical protein